MFVHLHNHTHYSLLDGLTRPFEAVAIAKKQGAPAIAITDHGNLYGAIEFYKEAKKQDIKPIIGCEMYVAPQGRLRKEPGSPINHLTVLAQSTEGYHNLIQLTTKAHREGFYYKPRVDHGLLREFRSGLIALSGCLNSEISQAILEHTEEKALEIIRMYQEIFGTENFFLEVQDHPELPDQLRVNQALYRLANEARAPLVATCDSHYAKTEDRAAHDILLCIQTGTTINDPKRMKLDGDFSMRSPEDIACAFKDHPEAIENSAAIAERCTVEIAFGKNLIPVFKTPGGADPQSYLRKLCEHGLRERYGDSISPQLRERFEYELKTIHEQGFDNYFLIVHDVVRHAKEDGVLVGPGRGSAAGSLVAYCLQITDVDPLPYDLLFERFLNPARISMPDIDIDFDDVGRSKVLQYVVNKYGRENVAQIITFGTMAARAAVRDVGRALGIAYGRVDAIAKLVPPPVQGRHVPLKISTEEDAELRKVFTTDPEAKKILEYAIRLEGTVRHAGTHACAVVMSEEPLTNYTPLQKATGEDDSVITQFSMKPIEDLGLLKMDFLGLKNLTVIDATLTAVKKIHGGEKPNLQKIPLTDKKTFELLARGDTTGVFQLESGGMRRYLKELIPSDIHDIIAMVSLFRPGPMAWIPMYIKGKHEAKSVKYIHSSFEPILKETYGVAVYQEQILKIAQEFAGFSLGEADILRKAVGKKDPTLLQEEKNKFIQGAVSKGHSKAFAEDVFQKVIEPFAAYGFNKSHGTCYAMIAYHTAYLKANYPAEFMAALLTADAGNEERIVIEVNECEAMGIRVLAPDINESDADFTVINDETIRFGLRAIKGIGDQSIAAIIASRSAGKFLSLEDFFRRIPAEIVNKKFIEALAYSGAFDALGERHAIAASFENLSDFSKGIHDVRATGQGDLFEMLEESSSYELRPFQLKKVLPATRLEKLQYEKQFLGLYVSGHPLQGLGQYLSQKAMPIGQLRNEHLGKTAKFCVLISGTKRITTRSGAAMMYVTGEDLTGRIEAVLFPKTYQQYGSLVREGTVLSLQGKIDLRGDRIQLLADSLSEVSLESMIQHAKKNHQFREDEPYVRVHGNHTIEKKSDEKSPYIIEVSEKIDGDALAYLKKILAANRGSRSVLLKFKTSGGTREIPVPFGVDVSPQLIQQVGDIVGG